MKADFNFQSFLKDRVGLAFSGSRIDGATKVVASRKFLENYLSTATEYLIRHIQRISWANELPR